MQILKPNLSRFQTIQDFPYRENFIDFEGLQMHYIDEGTGEVILALHGEPSWSYLYRTFVPVLSNYRFIAPDFIGFGKSDKILGWRNYSFELHYRSMEHLLLALDLRDVTLVVQDWGGILGLSLLGAYPERFKRVVILNTALPAGEPFPPIIRAWRAVARIHPSLPVARVIQFGTYNKLTKETLASYKAPFENWKYKGGAKSFPLLLPKSSSSSGSDKILKAREILSQWTKPALVMFSDHDPVIGYLHEYFHNLIPSVRATEKIVIPSAGHFLQEDQGELIATHIDRFMQRSSITN